MKSQKILVALVVVILLVNVAVGGVLIWEAQKQTKLERAQADLLMLKEMKDDWLITIESGRVFKEIDRIQKILDSID